MEPVQPVPNNVSKASSSRGSMESSSWGSVPDKDEEQNKKPKKISDEMIAFVKERSGADAPRVLAKINSFKELERKRRRAAEVRGRARMQDRGRKSPGKKPETAENSEHRRDDQRMNRRQEEKGGEKRPRSRSPTAAPVDRCGRRRRRRRRSCRRRSRCRRRRSRCRRRRRSRSRRRRRRSYRRRRRRARRCRR